ncbi:MAG: MASE3 domain-containing protein [Deltaproteobacteria bacterium]|jgi:PAS domain S-box-containing protein
MNREVALPNSFKVVFSWVLILSGLYLTSLYSYLLFHSLSEIFSVVVACGIFTIAWNSRKFLDNNYLLFIGIGYLFVGGVDLLHTMAYKGMGVFQGDTANLPTQLWIAARYIESFSLLLAPLFLGRKLRPNSVLIGYFLVVVILLTSIFYWRIFPNCFVEGVGLTSFKKRSEYIICFILVISVVLLIRKQKEFDKVVLRFLVASIFLTIAAELAFTFYISVYGISNLLGHFCKIISFYLIYKAIIETGLTKPYDLLFRDLKQSEEALRGKEAILREIIDLVPHAIYANDRDGVHLLANRKAAELLGTTVENLTTARFSEVIHEHEQLKHFLADTRQVFDTGQPKFIPEERIIDGDGNLQFLQTTKIPFIWPDSGEQVVLGVSVVITDQKRAEAALRESHFELERRVEERTGDLIKANEQLKQEIEERRKAEERLAERIRLEGLRAGVGVALAKGDNLRTLLQPCTEALVEQLGAAFARIWTYNEAERRLELQASAGLYTGIDGSYSRLSIGQSKVGIIARDRRPQVTNDILGDPNIADQEWTKVTGLVAFAGYPVIFADRLIGVMAMFGGEPFGEFTLEALASVADQIALGIQRQRAEEALRRSGEELRLLSSQLLAAQETERGRIARELHDGIGQSLSAIKFRVEDALGQLAKGSTESAVSTLDNLIPLIQGTVEEVRRITMDLRPSTLDDLGILSTIAWLCREFQATYSTLEIKREITAKESEIPSPLKIVLYRVLQEALNNVAKHSGADKITISLTKKDNNIQLAVEDNGYGFDVKEALSVESSQRGFGLGSMKERTELSGGTFLINSGKGSGTFILASWPYDHFHRKKLN